MKKLYFMMMVVFMIASLVLTACGGGSEPTMEESSSSVEESSSNTDSMTEEDGKDNAVEDKLVVGFSQTDNNNPWKIAETKSVRDEAKNRGYEMVYADAQADTEKQIADVMDMVNSGVDYIILSPREYEGLASALDAAKAAGIPVILIDREAKGTAGEDYLTYIGSDFIKEGKRAGEWLVDQTGDQAKIIELMGTEGASVTVDRKKGFEEIINQNDNMTIIASQTGNFSRVEGQQVMSDLLQTHGDEVTAVYAHNDEMAIGAINAIKSAGKVPGEDIEIISIDGTHAALQAIIDGELGATVECSPFFGPTAFDVIEKHMNGEQVQPKIINEDRFFDQSNAAEFVGEAY